MHLFSEPLRWTTTSENRIRIFNKPLKKHLGGPPQGTSAFTCFHFKDFFFVYVYIACMLVCVWVHVYGACVCVCMCNIEAQGWCRKPSLNCSSTVFTEAGCLNQTQSWSIHLVFLASMFWGSSASPFKAGIISEDHGHPEFMWILHIKHFNHWAISCPVFRLKYKTLVNLSVKN